FAATLFLSPASAQSWGDRLQQLLGGGTTEQTQPAAVQTPPASQAELYGDWTYRAPIIEYTGDDMLAALAVGTLREQLAATLAKAGLVPGQGTVSFRRRGGLHLSLAGHQAEGSYGYDARQGALTVTLVHGKTRGTINGKAATADGRLFLRFDAKRVLEVIRQTIPQSGDNEKLQQLGVLLENYPGIVLGGELSR
ncbi:MAG: DUF4923 family protein, partial [Alistipes sp.]|nr:DUF4923 family protein [Alistipes sp.]